MNKSRFANLVAAAFGLAVLSNAGCTEKDRISADTPPPAKDGAILTATTAGAAPSLTVQAAANPEVASARWAEIKDCTYDMHVPFFAGLKRLEARVDEEMGELNAKRAAMKATTDTQDWDFAMKEMDNARSYLKSMGEELSEATRETWDQEKDKVGQAWVKTQEAYHKVKSATTS
jgi:hypothetical protein